MLDQSWITASAVVLFDHAVSREELVAGLTSFPIRKHSEPEEEWACAGAGVWLDSPPGCAGAIFVDTVPHRWPDDMGDSDTESDREPGIVAAWKQGQFGPVVQPGCLTRAALQSWAWPEARDVPLQHRAFVRVRVCVPRQQEPHEQTLPSAAEPWDALALVTRVSTAILARPGALAFFNPNGETLRSQELVQDAWEYAESANIPPLDLWANVRLFELDAGWKLMDTVGNAQFHSAAFHPADCRTAAFHPAEHAERLPDLEACVPPGDRYDLQEVDGFLRDITLFLLTRNIPIQDGDTVPGPGRVLWTAHARQQPLTDPPRRVLRFFPDDGSTPPDSLLGTQTGSPVDTQAESAG